MFRNLINQYCHKYDYQGTNVKVNLKMNSDDGVRLIAYL